MYLDLARELKKAMEHERDSDNNCYWLAWYSHQKVVKGTGGLRNKRTSRDHPNENILKIGLNTDVVYSAESL